MRRDWSKLTLPLAVLVTLVLWISHTNGMSLILWLSLISLFLHQFEEWCYPGYFLEMVNTAMFKSDIPDRFPLNTNSGMVINVGLGWTSYLLAALFWEHAIWLGIATIIVSIGNIFAHTLIFNIKGKTLYNPGLLTSWICFAPIVYMFLTTVASTNLATRNDWLLGITVGILLNYFGVYRMIIWLADRNTVYVFKNPIPKNLPPH